MTKLIKREFSTQKKPNFNFKDTKNSIFLKFSYRWVLTSAFIGLLPLAFYVSPSNSYSILYLDIIKNVVDFIIGIIGFKLFILLLTVILITNIFMFLTFSFFLWFFINFLVVFLIEYPIDVSIILWGHLFIFYQLFMLIKEVSLDIYSMYSKKPPYLLLKLNGYELWNFFILLWWFLGFSYAFYFISLLLYALIIHLVCSK